MIKISHCVSAVLMFTMSASALAGWVSGGSETVAKPWSMGSGALLGLELTHELGHVFGHKHIGSAEFFSIMDEDFPQFLLEAEVAKAFESVPL